MRRANWTILATGGLMGAMWALTPGAPARHLPAPVAAPVSSQGGLLVVDLDDGSTEADLQRVEALLGADLDWVHELARDEALSQGRVEDLAAAVARLEGLEGVEAVEPSVTLQALSFPNDPLYPRQWHLGAVGAPEGWARTPKGRGITVAVIDTGVAKVPDLDPERLLDGASFVPSEPDAIDRNGHGTHVAGTIAQTTGNGLGTAGVAPEATILPVKVLSAYGGGESPWIAAGIDYAVDQGADVINLSLGGPYSRVVELAVHKARAKGVLVIAAAGNSGREGVSWPGALADTIGVAAVGPKGTLAPYSSWGEGVDLAAPGGDKSIAGGGVLQNTIDGAGGSQYAELQGTSMATPHVAGAAAVLLSTGLTPDEVERAMLLSGGQRTWEPQLGFGAMDLGRALDRSQGSDPLTRFALAGIVALLLTGLTRMGSGARAVSAAVAAVVAGGLFFLPALGPWTLTLRQALLLWPTAWVGAWGAGFPLWLSALGPLLAVFVLGAFRPGRPLAVGFAVGIGTHLIYGAATGTLSPWLMPGSIGVAWLGVNGALSLLMAMALMGADRLERGEER
ncbi:MAG: S8 family serine peptidase [Deltaproteobacteria bacterium]|nr:S8 family serine peptidase [Deltaproteobacteria bacterium]